jgi:hypothetical protein
LANEIELSDRLVKALEVAVITNFSVIEDWEADEQAVNPQVLYWKAGAFTIETFLLYSTDQAVEAARKDIRAKSSEIDIYVLSYSAYLTEGSGKRIDGLVLEAGEKGDGVNLIFFQPFERNAEGKVSRLTEKPVLRGKGPQLL